MNSPAAGARARLADFYLETIRKAGIGPDETVLVLCGGSYDRRTLEAAGIATAVISNLGHHDGATAYGNYAWERQDAENVARADGSVDWAVVHAGLHHCASPHRALCEMLRVASKGIVVVESRDSLVSRLARRLGLVPDYELEPALLSNGERGGYRDTAIPNYIYRWTESEIEKTVASFDPAHRHAIRFYYDWRLPMQRIAMARNPLVRLAVRTAAAARGLLRASMPKQGNCFGIVVRKTQVPQPWVKRQESGELLPDLAFIAARYDRSKYGRR